MGLGPTLLGAIIGAAVGVGLHQGLEYGMLGRPIEAPWFAIVIGICTGLGVRKLNKSLMSNVSYARGAVTGLIALGAIVGSIQLVSVLASRKGALTPSKPLADAKATDTDEGDAAKGDGKADATPPPIEQAPVAGAVGAGQPKIPGAETNIYQFIFMAVGAFIAYELGRGGVKAAAPAAAPPGEVAYTDPSN